MRVSLVTQNCLFPISGSRLTSVPERQNRLYVFHQGLDLPQGADFSVMAGSNLLISLPHLPTAFYPSIRKHLASDICSSDFRRSNIENQIVNYHKNEVSSVFGLRKMFSAVR